MEEDINLELNTDSVRERTGVRSSLTDMNEIHVFTNGFEEKKEETDKAVQNEEAALRNKVFDYQIVYESEDITDRLFLDNTGETLIRDVQTAEESQSISVFAGMMTAVVILTSVLAYWIIRRGRRKDDVDNKHKAAA